MRIIVQKFGGTSVAGLDCMRKVKEKVEKALAKGCKVAVVLSAMSGETNRLIGHAREWCPKPDPSELDVLMAVGEQTSVALFAILLKDAGIKARSVLAHQAKIKTDCVYGNARIRSIDADLIKAMFEDHDVLVVAGYQGCDELDRITTLGRGGSDTSAVALAAVLGAEVCEIYTDVTGVFTTDPNVCSKARKLKRIAYDEMLEMASMGAKVLQIRSVETAKRYKVPLHVRSTFADEQGTFVVQEDKDMEHVIVSGIAYDKDQALVTLVKIYDKPGIAATVFSPLAEANVLVDMIVQNPSHEGRTDMTFTVPKADLDKTLEIIRNVEQGIGAEEVRSDINVSKVSVIGVGMRNHSGVASRAFTALKNENINILLITTSEIKISLLVQEKYTELAVRTLHEAFGLEKPNNN